MGRFSKERIPNGKHLPSSLVPWKGPANGNGTVLLPQEGQGISWRDAEGPGCSWSLSHVSGRVPPVTPSIQMGVDCQNEG